MILSPVEKPHIWIYTFDTLPMTAAVLWMACYTGMILLPSGTNKTWPFTYGKHFYYVPMVQWLYTRYTTNTCSVSDTPTRRGSNMICSSLKTNRHESAVQCSDRGGKPLCLAIDKVENKL